MLFEPIAPADSPRLIPAARRCAAVLTVGAVLTTALGCHVPSRVGPTAAGKTAAGKTAVAAGATLPLKHQQMLLAELEAVQRKLQNSPQTAAQREQHELLLARRLWIIVALRQLELELAQPATLRPAASDLDALRRRARAEIRRELDNLPRGPVTNLPAGRRHFGEEGKMGRRDSHTTAAKDHGRGGEGEGLAERCGSEEGACQHAPPPPPTDPAEVRLPEEDADKAPAAARVAQTAPRAQVMQAVSGHLGQLSACLPAQLRGQQVIVAVRARVDATGAFRSPNVVADGLNMQVQACLLGVLRAVRVPDSQGESVVSFALYLGEAP